MPVSAGLALPCDGITLLSLTKRWAKESPPASSSPRATRRQVSVSAGMSWKRKPSSLPPCILASTMFRTGMRGAASWAVTTSQNTPRVRAS